MEISKSVMCKLYVISFLDLFAVALTFPVLAPYIRSLGFSHLTVGVLSSSYAALQVISGPIIGSWSDIRGRKSVFIVTLLLSAICYFLLGFCSTLISIFITRLLLGIFKHTQSLIKSTTSDYLNGINNSEIFGRASAYGSVGFVIGPVIGGHLSEAHNGFLYICIATSILFLINIGIVLSLPNSEIKPRINPEPAQPIMKKIASELIKSTIELKEINWRKYWVPFVLKFLYVLSTTIFFVNQSLYLKEKFNLPQRYVGYTISFISIVGVFSMYFLGNITKKFYKDSYGVERSYHCFFILTLCLSGFYFFNNLWLLLVLLVPFGACNAILRITTMEMLYKNIDQYGKGSITGASDSMMSLGRFIAPLSAGIVGNIFNENAVMLYAMLACLIATGICYFTKNSYKDVKVL